MFSRIVREIITHVVAVYANELMMVGSKQAQIGALTEWLRGRSKEITVQEEKQEESRSVRWILLELNLNS